MTQPSPQFASVKTETDVAVLRVQYENLSDKVDEVKTDLKDMRTHFDDSMSDLGEQLARQIAALQTENKKQHDEVNTRLTAIEKWKWMIMGAAILAGSVGPELISKVLGVLG